MRKIIAQEKQLTEIFKFSERTVRDYFVGARVSPGKYDLVECMKIYVNRWEALEDDKELKRIEKETKLLKLEILENKYHKVEDVQRIVLDMLANFKSKLSVLPIKIGQDFINENLIANEKRLKVQDVLKERLDETLNELAEYEYKENELEEELEE